MLAGAAAANGLHTETPRETSSEATNSDAESDYFNSFNSRFDYGSQSAGVALLAAASLAAAASSSNHNNQGVVTVAQVKQEQQQQPQKQSNGASSLFLYEPLNIMRPNGLMGSVGMQSHEQNSNYRYENIKI